MLQAAKAGMQPKALLDRPDLDSENAPLLEWFSLLSDGRSYGMAGPNPLTNQDVLAFFQIYGIDDLEERDFLFRLFRALDKRYLESAYKKTETGSKP